METTAAFAGLRCHDCGSLFDPTTTGRCPDCGGSLDVDVGEPPADRPFDAPVGAGLERYAAVLPFPADALVRSGVGGTPAVDCPGLAADLGVESLVVKDEGQNPTGALADRGATLAVTAARELGATDVALPSTGTGARAVAAAASRAGLDSHAFVPSRTPFANKAMINVHGGDMTVVGGRYADAAAAYREALAGADWLSLAAFESPYRHEGAATVAYELLDQRGWRAPDAVVVPTGHGTALVGLELGFRRAETWGLVETTPRLYAAQAAGCAPVADAWHAGAATVEPVESPDTIAGPLEIPDPAGGDRVLSAVADSDGGCASSEDPDLLAAALELAKAGVSAGTSGGAALAGAAALADRDELGSADTVVVVNPTGGTTEADLLRSQLMSQGQ